MMPGFNDTDWAVAPSLNTVPFGLAVEHPEPLHCLAVAFAFCSTLKVWAV